MLPLLLCTSLVTLTSGTTNGACFLQDAVRDMLYLKESNDELELKLKQAAEWEPDVR